MKKSKKIVAIVMSACMACALPAIIAGCKPKPVDPGIVIPEQKDPVKVNEGGDISVKVGASSPITISDYITANGNEVNATSSDPQIAEAKVEEGKLNVKGIAAGSATITLSCKNISVTFKVKVVSEQQLSVVFENCTADLDLRLNGFLEVPLAPKSGGDGLDITYSLDGLANDATIEDGNKLKFTPTETGAYVINVTAHIGSVEKTFKVTITVKHSVEVSINGIKTLYEYGEEYIFPAYDGAVPEGKTFTGYKVGSAIYKAGDKIEKLEENISAETEFTKNKYTLTVDGVASQVEHGDEYTFQAYTKKLAEGMVFDGYKVEETVYGVGDKITVTSDVTAVVVTSKKKYSVTINGVKKAEAEHGDEYTFVAYDGVVPEGKEFEKYTVGKNEYSVGGKIRVVQDIVINVVFKLKKYSVKIEGVEKEEIEHGKTYTLPEYVGTLPDGKQFGGWQVGNEVFSAGSDITVKNDLNITASITDIPEVAPVLVKASDSFDMVVGTETGTKVINIADYITTNGHAVSVGTSSNTEVATKTATSTQITITAHAEGEATFKITCGEIEVTITVSVTTPPPQKIKDGEDIKFLLSDGVSTITVADYITVNSNAVDIVMANMEVATAQEGSGVITITAQSAGKTTLTLTCKNIVLTFAVVVKNSAPTFDDVDLNIDKYLSGSATHEITPASGANTYSYEYTVEGATITGSELSVTADANTTLTVNVRATDSATDEVVTSSFTVNVTVEDSTPTLKNDIINDETTRDLYLGFTINLAENITNPKNHAITYKVNGVEVEGSNYKVNGEYTQTATQVEFTITALFGSNKSLEYAYKVKLKDTTAYRIQNGDFENWVDGKPVGWTITTQEEDGVYGTEHTISKYWEEYEFNNVGKYFGELREIRQGTLQSSTFIIGNSGWVTFQFGAAKPVWNIYMEVVDASNNQVLAKFKNIEWEDPIRAQSLVPYKVNLHEFDGKSVFIRVVDAQEGEDDFRFFLVDSFKSWYDSEPMTMRADNGNSLTFVNIGAPKFDDITSSLDLKDGNSLSVTLPDSVSLGVKSAITYTTQHTQCSINDKVLTFTPTKSGEYVIVVKGTTSHGNADFKVTVTVTNTKEEPTITTNVGQINIDSGTLTKSLTLPAENDNFTCSYAIKTAVAGASIADNVFTYEATTEHEKGSVPVTVTATFTDKAKPDEKHTKDYVLVIEIVGNNPTLKSESITKEKDLDGKTSKEFTLDLSSNINVPNSVTMSYSVEKAGDTTVDGTLNGSSYTLTLSEGVYSYTVTATYGDSQTLTYTYIVKVAQYTVINCGFETGDLSGWTLDGYTPADGANIVQNTAGYWGGKGAYNHSGVYHFNGQAPDGIPEGQTYTLKSSPFVLGGSGFISFKIGGRAAVIKIYDNETNLLLAEYTNTAYRDVENTHIELGCRNATMTTYVADLHAHLGKKLYLVLEDNLTGGWGHSIMDEVITYYETAPVVADRKDTVTNLCGDGGTTDIPWVAAVNRVESFVSNKYQVYNGNFETGDLSGWVYVNGAENFGRIVSDNYYWNNESKLFNKEGTYLFTGIETAVGTNQEGGVGTLRSSTFILKQNSWISFLLGGAHNDQCGIRVKRASDNEVLAEFNNIDKGSDGAMDRYKYQFSGMTKDELCYIEIFDNATKDWGLVVVDDIKTSLDSEPADGTLITPVVPA